MTISPLRKRLMFAWAFAALSLSGCDKPAAQNNAQNGTESAAAPAANVAPPLAALPLAQGTATNNAPAPPAASLPPSPPVRYAALRSDRYAYLDRAHSFGRALADAPPDYTYDFGNEQPWVWRSDDGYERVAEQLPGGGVRYYYYQPGAEQPYLVQDPDYAYGYSDGELTVVYDSNGDVLSDELAQRQADIAGRYLARGRALYAASMRERHAAVAEEDWNRQREAVYADQARWQEQQDSDAAWHAYHQAHQAEDQAHWADERYRRAAEAARFAQAINDAQAAGRAAQALKDADDEARRYGHNGRDQGQNQAPPERNPPNPSNEIPAGRHDRGAQPQGPAQGSGQGPNPAALPRAGQTMPTQPLAGTEPPGSVRAAGPRHVPGGRRGNATAAPAATTIAAPPAGPPNQTARPLPATPPAPRMDRAAAPPGQTVLPAGGPQHMHENGARAAAPPVTAATPPALVVPTAKLAPAGKVSPAAAVSSAPPTHPDHTAGHSVRSVPGNIPAGAAPAANNAAPGATPPGDRTHRHGPKGETDKHNEPAKPQQ